MVYQDQSKFQEERLESQQTALEQVEKQLNKLLDLLLIDQLDNATYKTKKKELENKKREIKNKIDNTDNNLENGRMKIEDALDFVYACQKRFADGLRAARQEIMTRIGSVKLKDEFGVLANKQNWGEVYKS